MLTKHEHGLLGCRRNLALAAACLLLPLLLPVPAAGASPLNLPHAAIGAITITITAHPRAVSNVRAATFGWSTTGIVGETRCRIDAHPYTYCPGHPARYSGLGDGMHTFTIRIRNGYQVTQTASYSWLIDTAPPTDPVLSGGSLAWRALVSASITASGSSDALSGLAGYQWRSSTDGAPWGGASSGAVATIKAQGETSIQFRSVDQAGNTSAWLPLSNGTGNLLRIDRTPPTAATVVGGSSSWQGVASETVTGSGSTDARSGVEHYEYRESTTSGAGWGAPQIGSSDTVTAEGETLVQFRAVDAAGNDAAWAPATAGPASTVRIDRSGPTDPVVAGGSLSWSDAAAVTVTAAGSVDVGFGVDHYQHRESTDGGVSWSSPVTGTSLTVSAEGQTLVQFQAVDTAGNGSQWAPASGAAAGTVRLDRAAPADPTVGITPAGWQSAPAILVFASGSTDALAGVDHYQYRTSINKVSAWAPAAPTAGSSVRIDRTLPTTPTVTGGSLSWQDVPSITITASGSTDAGGALLAGYQYRTSSDGGITWSSAAAGPAPAVSAEGRTLLEYRSQDGAGNVSSWTPTTPGAANTARIDRTPPTVAAVSGGSLTCASQRTIAGTGASDSGGSGVSHYEYRISTDNGVSYGVPVTGASVALTIPGSYVVQLRAVDGVGLAGAWAPTNPVAANTACIT